MPPLSLSDIVREGRVITSPSRTLRSLSRVSRIIFGYQDQLIEQRRPDHHQLIVAWELAGHQSGQIRTGQYPKGDRFPTGRQTGLSSSPQIVPIPHIGARNHEHHAGVVDSGRGDTAPVTLNLSCRETRSGHPSTNNLK